MCSSPLTTALRKACAFVCVAGGVVRTLGIRFFEIPGFFVWWTGVVVRSMHDDVVCIVLIGAFLICFAMLRVMIV
jgi:hypothetical protein